MGLGAVAIMELHVDSLRAEKFAENLQHEGSKDLILSKY